MILTPSLVWRAYLLSQNIAQLNAVLALCRKWHPHKWMDVLLLLSKCYWVSDLPCDLHKDCPIWVVAELMLSPSKWFWGFSLSASFEGSGAAIPGWRWKFYCKKMNCPLASACLYFCSIWSIISFWAFFLPCHMKVLCFFLGIFYLIPVQRGIKCKMN